MVYIYKRQLVSLLAFSPVLSLHLLVVSQIITCQILNDIYTCKNIDRATTWKWNIWTPHPPLHTHTLIVVSGFMLITIWKWKIWHNSSPPPNSVCHTEAVSFLTPETTVYKMGTYLHYYTGTLCKSHAKLTAGKTLWYGGRVVWFVKVMNQFFVFVCLYIFIYLCGGS